ASNHANHNSDSSSVAAGITAVVDQVTAFTEQCPVTKVVMVGYSQGSQIMDDVFCGGPDGSSLTPTAATLSADMGDPVVALIWMGDPRNVPGLPYNIGTAQDGGMAMMLRTISNMLRYMVKKLRRLFIN
ncbi:cutinase-domain-containing protein, partial [Xylariaceae sp. FL0016]